MTLKPLSEEEIHKCFCYVEYETLHNWNKDPEGWCIAFARALERSLGIVREVE